MALLATLLALALGAAAGAGEGSSPLDGYRGGGIRVSADQAER